MGTGSSRSPQTRRPPKRLAARRIWNALVNRCCNPNNTSHKDYGDRGIVVCDRWRFGENGLTGFQCFLADMGPRPSPTHSIDRIDFNGNYDPSNCRWADTLQQANNTRKNHYVTIAGETHTLAEWARSRGVAVEVLKTRIKLGWPSERLLDPSSRSTTVVAAVTEEGE
jgi:hypothetical protein